MASNSADLTSDEHEMKYPSQDSEFATEVIGFYPPKQPRTNAHQRPTDEEVDKENIQFINSKCDSMAPPNTPRPLPKTPITKAKGNDDDLDKTQAGDSFDNLLGGMLSMVQSEGVALEPGRDSVAVNPVATRGTAFLGSLVPLWAENHGIKSNATDQENENWFGKAVKDHKSEAATRMERFLAGRDELTAVNGEPTIDLGEAEAPKPKKKKKKSGKKKLSSKQKKREKARKIALESAPTSAEHEHDTPQRTTNEVNDKIPSSDASTAAEHEHDSFLHLMDKNSKIYPNEKPEDASISAGQDTSQNTTHENTVIYTNKKPEDALISTGQDTLEDITFKNTEICTNQRLENTASSTEHDTSQHTTHDNLELDTKKSSMDEEKAVADVMTDAAIRTVVTSKKGKEKMSAQVQQAVRHDADASNGFTEQEITNINEFMNFFQGKIELHDRLFVEMQELIQSLVAELRGFHSLPSKYTKVIEDLRAVSTRLHDVDTRTRMNTHSIRERNAGGVGDDDVASMASNQTGMVTSDLRGVFEDAKQVKACTGSVDTTESQKLGSRVGRLQRELNDEVRRIDIDIARYGEINIRIQGSIKTLRNDIVGLQRSSKLTKWELAEVVKTVRDLDKNFTAIRDTLNEIVKAAHKVPTLQQMLAKYEHAMKKIDIVSAKCDQLKELVNHSTCAFKKCNDEILGRLDQHAERLNKHGERLNNCHVLFPETRDVVKGHENHLNTLKNKVNSHQKLIAKVTSESASNTRRLNSLTDTTTRDIESLSHSTVRDIKSLSESTTRNNEEIFAQVKETQAQIKTLKANVEAQAEPLAHVDDLNEQRTKDMVMKLLDPIASKVDKLCAKVEAYLGPLDDLAAKNDGAPKPKKLSFPQKNIQKKAIAAIKAAFETQQTSTQPTGDVNNAVQTNILDAFPAAETESKIPKVRIPQTKRIRSKSMPETPAAASPAPMAPHPTPPGHPAVAARPLPVMQIMKHPEQRRSSLAREQRYAHGGPLPESVVAQRHDRMVLGHRMAEQAMVSPMAMDRVMMAPQNAFAQNGYGQGQMVATQQQMVVGPRPELGGQSAGLLPQIFGSAYDQEYDHQQFDQQRYGQQQFDQQYGQQHHDQFGQEMRYPIGHPLAIIPVDESIQPAPYIPQEDPRDNHIMLLTYNVDNLNARVNEATNAMSVAQSSIRNFRTQYRYEIGQEVEREVERAMGREAERMEKRINQNVDRRMNNAERRVSDRTS